MLNNLLIKEVTSNLNSESYLSLNNLIKTQNSRSILASLNFDLIKKYLEIAINSNNLFLYICEKENKIIGYALLAKKPSFLITEFTSIKYKILINLLLKFKFITLINILLSLSKLDLIFIPN